MNGTPNEAQPTLEMATRVLITEWDRVSRLQTTPTMLALRQDELSAALARRDKALEGAYTEEQSLREILTNNDKLTMQTPLSCFTLRIDGILTTLAAQRERITTLAEENAQNRADAQKANALFVKSNAEISSLRERISTLGDWKNTADAQAALAALPGKEEAK